MNASLLHGLMWVIFAFTYIGLAFGKYPWLVLDRAGIALVGGIAMLLIGALGIHQAAGSIDYRTILLLFGLMVFSAQLHEAGFYDSVGEKLTHLSERPKTLLACLILVSAVLSALLANDIVCLAFTPLLCASLIRAGRNPIPYLLALATSSNIGSASTLIGNPQNMYIGSASGLLFGSYVFRMLVPVLVGLLLCFVGVVVIFGDALREKHDFKPAQQPEVHPPEWHLIVKTLVLLVGLIGYFVFARGSDAAEHRSIAALAGAGVLFFSHHPKAAKLYTRVDFNLILLFLGLFVVNGAMSNQHLTNQIFGFIRQLHIDLNHPVMLAGAATVLSNIVSNVPAVLLLSPAVHSSRDWYLLALISTFAGNLTLVGSIANLIVAEGARKFDVKISLWTYCKLGVPLTVGTVIVGTLWLMWI
jgi:Na+/H+ antiporter NhaD/arsenite permease-like protein